MTAPTRLSDADARELLLQTFLEVQQAEQARGTVPGERRTVLGRFRWFFEYACAVMLGLLIASTCMLMVFVVTRVLLHIDFSRYAWL